MPNDVIVDTGLLFALFDRNDQYHERAVRSVNDGRFAFLTTLATITETVHLLRRCPVENTLNFLNWIRCGAVQIISLDVEDFGRICDVMAKYADLRPDFADATLVAIADRLQINRIATFDRDFDVYRYRGKFRFRNVLR